MPINKKSDYLHQKYIYNLKIKNKKIDFYNLKFVLVVPQGIITVITLVGFIKENIIFKN